MEEYPYNPPLMRAFIALIAATWKYGKGRRLILVAYVLMFCAANLVLLAEPVVIGAVLNSIQQIATLPNPVQTLSTLFGLMIGIQFAFWAFHGPARVLENNTAFHAKNAFSAHLFQIVTCLPVQWHKDHHSGQTISRMRKSTTALYDFISNSYQSIEMVMRLIGSVVALFLLFPMAGVIALGVSCLAVYVVFIFDKILLPQYDEINEREHHTASALHDYMTNIFTVISLRLEHLTRTELWNRMNVYLPLYKNNNRVNETKWFIATIIIAVMTVFVLGWYAFATLSAGGVLLTGTVYMLYDYLQKIGASFYTFAWKYSTTVYQHADLRTTREILGAETESRSGDKSLPPDWRTLEIRGLSFSYQDEERRTHHLENVSFTIERGKRIAFVGESGSGKSTLMSLIRGLQKTDTVQVLCDGVELPGALAALSSHVTLMPQEPEIFSNTIEYNVSVDTQQTEGEILRDIELAQFLPVVQRLPKGLKTNIAEKGVNLSGGEKQRLALARGIFAARGSDIILMDEPTSSVDTVNELKVFENIFREFADRCIVASVHRLHLLAMFDHVVVLQTGRVVEQGNPVELLRRDSLLKTIVQRMEEAMQRQNAAQTPAN